MSILLSDEELRTIGLCIIAQSRDGYVTGEGVTQMQRDTAKAAAIHAVQYLEELCPNVSHKSVHFECKRVNCPDCMKQIHEELGQ